MGPGSGAGATNEGAERAVTVPVSVLDTRQNEMCESSNHQFRKQVGVNTAECDARSRSYLHLAGPLPETAAFEALMRGLIEDNSSRTAGCFHGTRRLQ